MGTTKGREQDREAEEDGQGMFELLDVSTAAAGAARHVQDSRPAAAAAGGAHCRPNQPTVRNAPCLALKSNSWSCHPFTLCHPITPCHPVIPPRHGTKRRAPSSEHAAGLPLTRTSPPPQAGQWAGDPADWREPPHLRAPLCCMPAAECVKARPGAHPFCSHRGHAPAVWTRGRAG